MTSRSPRASTVSRAVERDPRMQAALERAVELGQGAVQVAAYRQGVLIVDDWIGSTSRGPSSHPIDGTTLFVAFSGTKALVLAALHLQVQRGVVSLGDRVASVWPEFAAHGKEAVTIADVLTHRSGVPQMPSGLTPERMGNWDEVTAGIADLPPLRPPGERSQYSGYTASYIVAEVVRRSDAQHRDIDRFVREELLRPWGIEDVWIGVPEHQEHRVADLPSPAAPASSRLPKTGLRASCVPPAIAPVPDVYNLPAMRRAMVPASTAVMSARSAARFFGGLAAGGVLDGHRLFDEGLLRRCAVPRRDAGEVDEATGVPMPIGAGGFWTRCGPLTAAVPAGPASSLLAVEGVMGVQAWAELDTGVAVAIAHDSMIGMAGEGEHPLQAVAAAARQIAADETSAGTGGDGQASSVPIRGAL